MDILFIAPINITANASAGAETINYYINEFSLHDNNIDVIAYTKGRYQRENIKYHILNPDTIVQSKIKIIYKAVGWVLYPQNKYLYKTTPWQRKQIFTTLIKLKNNNYNPDIIMLDTTSSILLYPEIRKLFPAAKLIGDLHDFAFQGSQRKAALEKNALLRIVRNRYLHFAEKNEVSALCQMDYICPHNAGNILFLKDYEQLKNKKLVPIVPYYSADYIHDNTNYNRDVLFYGLMSRPENYLSAIWFIENVVPILPEEFRFVVMGGKPVDKLKNYSSKKVYITGFVSEKEVKVYFEHSFCMVVPLLFGSGIKTKVLTALKSGLPSLVNSVGIEGIDVVDGTEYYHCETPSDYVNAIEKLRNQTTYEKISENAKLFMNNEYDLKKCSVTLLRLFKESSN